MSTVNQPPQLNLDELRRLKWLLGGVVALISLWTVFFLDIEAAGLVGVVGAVILATLIWPSLPGRVPPLVWKLAVPGIIVTLVVDFYFSPDTLPVLIRTAILLVLYRAVAYRRKREDLQLIVLGLFLIVVAGVLTVSLGFAFLLLLFTAGALAFLFIVNLLEVVETGSNRTPAADLAWTRLTWVHLFGRLRAVTDWRLLVLASLLFSTVVGLSSLLFIIIPRFEVGSGFFLDKYITRKSKTGFSEVVRFGDVSELIRDNSVAMRVDVTDTMDTRAAPYWRLVVLDEYTRDGFKVSAGLKRQLLESQRVTQLVRGTETGRDRGTDTNLWTFYIEPGVSRFLPLPGNYRVVRMRDPVPVQAISSQRLIALRSEPMTMTALQMEGVDLNATVVDRRLPELLRVARERGNRKADLRTFDPLILLGGPAGENNARVLNRILAEITGGAALNAEEFSKRAVAWLQGRHAYALSVKLPRGADTDDIVRWLDSNEPGFCEYFAAGFTVLARAAGYPARVIAGYHGGIQNAFEHYYMVRNSDAHAWAEIFDGESAWLRVDATPGGVISGEDTTTAAVQMADNSWSARTDSLRVLWYRKIVNFDARNQVQMMESVKSFSTDTGQVLRLKLEAMTKRIKDWIKQPWDRGRLLNSAGVVFLVVVAVLFSCLLGRRVWLRWRNWRRAESFDPVRHEAGRWLGRLRASEKLNETSESVAIRADLQRLRYGHRNTWPEARSVFKRARRLKRAGK